MLSYGGDRFSGQNLEDCAFCPEGGRRFRTSRHCARCGRALCMSCRVPIVGIPSRCPDCSGTPRDDALGCPDRAAVRLQEEGCEAPFWLQTAATAAQESADELAIPE